jgi:hypothetical protein
MIQDCKNPKDNSIVPNNGEKYNMAAEGEEELSE